VPTIGNAAVRARKTTTDPQPAIEGSQFVSALALASGVERYVHSPVQELHDDLIAVFTADRPLRQTSTARQLRALALGATLAVCSAVCATFWLFVVRLALSIV
jgi:hypothetical protein